MDTGKENTTENTTLGYKAGATVSGCGGLIGSGDTRTVLSDGTIIDRGDMVECLEPPAGDQFYVWKYEGQKSQIGKKGKFGSVGMFGSILVVYIEGMEHIWPLCAIKKVVYTKSYRVSVLLDKTGGALTTCDWNLADKQKIEVGDRVKLYSWWPHPESMINKMAPDQLEAEGKEAIVLDMCKTHAQVKIIHDKIVYWVIAAMRKIESSVAVIDGRLKHSDNGGEYRQLEDKELIGVTPISGNEYPETLATGLVRKALPAPDITEATDSNGRTIKLKDRVRLLQDPADSEEMCEFLGKHGLIRAFFFLEGVRFATIELTPSEIPTMVYWQTRSLKHDPIDDNPEQLTASDMSRINEIKKLKQDIQDTRENRDSDKHLYASRLRNLRKSLTTVRRADPNIEF